MTAKQRVKPCMDCQVDTEGLREFYMVHNHVWNAAANDARGFLCIGCLERRLDRELTAADFTDCPLNTINTLNVSGLVSERLVARLAAREAR